MIYSFLSQFFEYNLIVKTKESNPTWFITSSFHSLVCDLPGEVGHIFGDHGHSILG